MNQIRERALENVYNSHQSELHAQMVTIRREIRYFINHIIVT